MFFTWASTFFKLNSWNLKAIIGNDFMDYKDKTVLILGGGDGGILNMLRTRHQAKVRNLNNIWTFSEIEDGNGTHNFNPIRDAFDCIFDSQ